MCKKISELLRLYNPTEKHNKVIVCKDGVHKVVSLKSIDKYILLGYEVSSNTCNDEDIK